MFGFLCCVCAFRTRAMKRATIDMTKAQPLDSCTCFLLVSAGCAYRWLRQRPWQRPAYSMSNVMLELALANWHCCESCSGRQRKGKRRRERSKGQRPQQWSFIQRWDGKLSSFIYLHTHNVLYILTPTLIGKELEKGKGGKAGMLGTNMDFLASVCCQCHECKTFASTGPWGSEREEGSCLCFSVFLVHSGL